MTDPRTSNSSKDEAVLYPPQPRTQEKSVHNEISGHNSGPPESGSADNTGVWIDSKIGTNILAHVDASR